MNFTYEERQELNALSKSIFNTSSFWRNKLLNRWPLADFEELKARMLKIKEDTDKVLNEMKSKSDYKPPEGLTLTGWHGSNQ